MRRLIASFTIVLAGLLVASSALSAGPARFEQMEPRPEKFRAVHVEDLAAMLSDSHRAVYVYDANPPGIREAFGIIPGAKLLGSVTDYSVATMLPAHKDARIVFYCRNEW